MKDDLGPLVALVIFVILTLVFGIAAYQNHAELVGDETQNPQIKSMDTKIKEIKTEVDDMLNEADNLRLTAQKLSEAIIQQQIKYEFQADLYNSFSNEHERRRKLIESVGQFEGQANELSTKVSGLKDNTLKRVGAEKNEVREQMDRLVQEKTTAKEASMARKAQLEEAFKTDKADYVRNRSYKQSALDDDTSVLGDLTQRDAEHATVMAESDGKVIYADPVNNLVVIDIGTSAGVKNGYRFECYTVRPGARKVIKGYLEVRRADPSKSVCVMLRRAVALPRDPLSEYVGRQPEEMFSPYQSGKEKSAQPLTADPKLAVLGAAGGLDPIIEGDLIQNPFFAPNKTLTFYILSPEKKGYIRYTKQEIAGVLEQYGCKVSPKVDINVNYVIAQRNFNDSTQDATVKEFNRVKDLGLPVIYEWELFRFLENK